MQKILILDFGGQYNQVLARCVRQCNVYCEVMSAKNITVEKIRAFDPIGIILTGDPNNSIHSGKSVLLPPEVYEMNIPLLGICYGAQVIAHQLGGKISQARSDVSRGYGRKMTVLDPDCVLFLDFIPESVTWMSTGDFITEMPEGFQINAHTMNCPVAAFSCPEKRIYGVQFHPEVSHTEGGNRMIRAFLVGICRAREDWTMEDYAVHAVQELRKTIGDGNVLLALSGGVDSSVAATLLNRAIGSQLTCVFVDTGLLRKNEAEQVDEFFSRMDMHFVRIDARDAFFSALKGVADPEEKRRVIGEVFAHIFEGEAKKMGHVDFFAQGTIYSDVIENANDDASRWQRNVAGWPEVLHIGKTVEPLQQLLKNEVRELGKAMGLPGQLINRQPFPEPGLAIRILGEVTREKVALLQEADYIFRMELEKAHMSSKYGQYFAVLTDTRSAGIVENDRVFGHVLALRAVTTDDFLTAKWARIPYEMLDKISYEIIRQVPGITRIVYDITSKPPAAIEWE